MSGTTSVDGASDLGEVADAVYAQLRVYGRHVTHMSRDVRELFIAAVRRRAARENFKITVSTALPKSPTRRGMYDRFGRSSPTEFTLRDEDGQSVAPDAHLQPPPQPLGEWPDADTLAELRSKVEGHLTFKPTDDELREVFGTALATQVLWDDDEAVPELATLMETNHTKDQPR